MHINAYTSHPLHLSQKIIAVALLALIFAQIEIQIEGSAGWAANLPTWRVEEHWLLDVFWGSRAMTGYHAWVFPFIALMFHFPLLFAGHFSWRAEARVLGLIILFWIVEDFLWFVMNPAYGLVRFEPQSAIWHKHWWLGAPVDYWLFFPLASLLLWLSCRSSSTATVQ